jgi:polyhydroxyalkanoate synthesis regulator phasin
MGFTKKWAVIVGTAAIATSIAAGSAFAASGTKGAAPNAADPTQPVDIAGTTERVDFVMGTDDHVKTPLSPAQEAVAVQLKALVTKHMEQLKTESTALIDQAVKDGKLTQAEADALKAKSMGRKGDHGKGGFQFKMKTPMNMTKEQRDAELDAAVKAGKLTQEQADKMKAAPMPAPGNKTNQHFKVTPEQFKQDLADGVKAGKFTQAQADEMLKKFNEHSSTQTN